MAQSAEAISGAADTAGQQAKLVTGPSAGVIGNLTAWLHKIEENPLTERVIMALIICNAVILGLETSRSMMASFGPVLETLDQIFLTIFVVELIARIIVHRWAFFRDRWSVFDFFVIGIALVPATNTFTVLRALRILRALRLITALPTLKRVAAGLLASLPGMGSIVFLIGLLYYVFAVLGTNLFGADNPNLFGTLGNALWTLFTVMTLEGWVNDVAVPVMEAQPYAWLFFVTYIVVTTFMVLNLFIGVVVNAMQEEAVKQEAAEREAEREMIQEESAPILTLMKELRAEVAELRAEMARRNSSGH
jgi:voltage-gated sodium channel